MPPVPRVFRLDSSLSWWGDGLSGFPVLTGSETGLLLGLWHPSLLLPIWMSEQEKRLLWSWGRIRVYRWNIQFDYVGLGVTSRVKGKEAFSASEWTADGHADQIGKPAWGLEFVESGLSLDCAQNTTCFIWWWGWSFVCFVLLFSFSILQDSIHLTHHLLGGIF